MEALAPLLALLILAVLVVFITGPIRACWSAPDGRAPEGVASEGSERIALLRAERAARLRELADAELDYRTGKLDGASYANLRDRLGREVLALQAALEQAGSADLEQGDRVAEQQDREHDRPAVEVALDHRTAAQRPSPGADPKGAGEAGVLAGVHQHQEHQDDRDQHLQDPKEGEHRQGA